MSNKKSVLFVCTGNICGSPTAEGVLRKHVEQVGLSVQVDSAGTHGYHNGETPDVRAVKAAAQRGYDIAQIKARRLCTEDYEKFDYLIALDDDHFDIMQRQCPAHLQHKLHRLLTFAPQADYAEVPDPYYGSPEAFELVLDLIEVAMAGLIVELSGASKPQA